MDSSQIKVITDATESIGYEVESLNPNAAMAGPMATAQAGVSGKTRTIEGNEIVETEKFVLVAKKVTRIPIPTTAP